MTACRTARAKTLFASLSPEHDGQKSHTIVKDIDDALPPFDEHAYE